MRVWGTSARVDRLQRSGRYTAVQVADGQKADCSCCLRFHSFTMAEQIEKSFQKQPLFHNTKFATTTSKKVSGKDRRWYKDVGLGFKTPKEAIVGTYIDKKCPFTGEVSIRGRILTGKVVSAKMNRTIIIRREYLHYVPKYNRYEKRHKNLAAHCSPAFRVEVGDNVTVGQCRPLSKTVRFNVLRVAKATKKAFVKF